MIRPALIAFGFGVMTQAASAEPLTLEGFFQGKLAAKGTIENFKEGTHRDFTMAMTASWSGAKGTLSEDVSYADGAREHKVWTFDRVAPGHYVGHREDVTRDADVFEDADGVHMSYKANTRLPSGSTYNLAFEDRLTAVSPTVVQVRSDVSYLFIPAARVTMTIIRAGT